MSKQQITPELAQSWIDAYKYEPALMHTVMRNVRRDHVVFLAKEMASGRFSSATIAFADCKEDGRRFVVNGNHTLRAIVESGVTLFLTVEYNDCNTMDEVRHLYATYDKNLTRKRFDSLRAYDAAGKFDINQTHVRTLSSAVGYMIADFGRNPKKTREVSDAELMERMRPWVPAFGQILAAVGVSGAWYKRIVWRRSVLSVALVTMRYQPDQAFGFWKSIAEGSGLKVHSPALRLRDYLMELMVSGGGRSSETRALVKVETQTNISRVVAYCWNKNYNGERIVLMKVPYDKPLSIAGAPNTVTTGTIKEPTTLATAGGLVPA